MHELKHNMARHSFQNVALRCGPENAIPGHEEICHGIFGNTSIKVEHQGQRPAYTGIKFSQQLIHLAGDLCTGLDTFRGIASCCRHRQPHPSFMILCSR